MVINTVKRSFIYIFPVSDLLLSVSQWNANSHSTVSPIVYSVKLGYSQIQYCNNSNHAKYS